MQRTIRTPTLEIAYLEYGPADGPVAILLHGFPDDPHCYDQTAPPLAAVTIVAVPVGSSAGGPPLILLSTL